MFKKHLMGSVLGSVVLLSACSSAPRDAESLIADSLAAMGSTDLSTIVYSGEGMEACVGQEFDPNVGWREFVLQDATRSLDLNAMGWRNQDVRVDDYQHGGCGAGPVATQTRNQLVRLSENSNRNQLMDFLTVPQGFLRYASQNGATVTTDEAGNEILVIDGGDDPDIMAYFDDNDYLVRVETETSESFLGTIPWTAEFTGWQEFEGVMFPTQIVEQQMGRAVYSMNVANAEPNASVDLGEDAKGKGKGGGGGGGKGKGKAGPVEISQQLGPGVHLVTDGYASLIVEMDDHVIIVGAGNNDGRVDQVVAEAERLHPDKEIRYVINTHHHHDHTTGLRGFAALGVTILTHELNRDYIASALQNPNTLDPGSLEDAGMPAAKIETFSDLHEIRDATNTIQMHRVQDSMHATGMVIVYLPELGVMLEADEFNIPGGTPGAGEVNPYHVNLVENIDRLGLNIRRIIPVHLPGDGHVVTLAELRAWAQM